MDSEEHLYKDALDLWTIFCKQNGLELHISRESDIADGGITKHLTFKAHNTNPSYYISQSFIQRDSWLDYIVAAGNLICLYEIPTKRNLFFSIWKKTSWEKFFNLNILKSGNPSFDNLFSAKSNMVLFKSKFLLDDKIQNMLIQNERLIFNIATKNFIMTILLKDMAYEFFNYDDLQMMNHNFKHIIEILSASIQSSSS